MCSVHCSALGLIYSFGIVNRDVGNLTFYCFWHTYTTHVRTPGGMVFFSGKYKISKCFWPFQDIRPQKNSMAFFPYL